jgi:hypothetical protein
VPGVDQPHVYRGRMRISSGDMSWLLSGRKHCTIRLGHSTVASANITMTDGKKSVRVTITGVENGKCFGDLTDREAQAEGFSSANELIADLRKYYPHATATDPVTIIYFSLPEPPPSLFD